MSPFHGDETQPYFYFALCKETFKESEFRESPLNTDKVAPKSAVSWVQFVAERNS
jgi:hypothetical protein